MLDDNELLFDELYEKTKDCGRVQFINLLMEKEREKQELKEQLDYLRSGEYLNQLRFERDMLQHVVDNNEVSKEDKEFIDMTHRNTELLEENQSLKDQVAYLRRDIERQEAKITDLEDERVPYTNEYVDKIKEVHNKAINHLDLFISDENLSKYDFLKILMYTKKILKEVE